jgi:hypothetical protein
MEVDWIDTDKRLPGADHQRVAIVYKGRLGFNRVDFAYWRDSEKQFFTYTLGNIPMEDITHWMTLPEPPIAKSKTA